jgi:hypothetical protein
MAMNMYGRFLSFFGSSFFFAAKDEAPISGFFLNG